MQTGQALPTDGVDAPRWQQLLTEAGLLEQVHSSFPQHGDIPSKNGGSDAAIIQDGLSRLAEPGQVVELRILGVNGKKRTDSGYFIDVSELSKAVIRYEGRAEGIYFTVNPVNPALMARANGRVKEYAEHTTSDNDILKRITLPIDFDPVRPAGISSNEVEKEAALHRAWACQAWLSVQGWPEPVFADSGNGAHLLYAIDLPNTPESTDLVKQCLLALSALFSDEQVKVDTSTGNASRIFKLYGTLARKGDNTPERPHRRAAILAGPGQRQIVNKEQLEALAAEAPATVKTSIQPNTSSSSSLASNGNSSYGKAALDKELAILAATRDGNRNNQLFRSSAALFGLVAAQALDYPEVWQALVSTAQSIGLSESEALRTIQSGVERGLSQPRILPKHSAAPSPRPASPSDELDIRLADPNLAPPASSASSNNGSVPFAKPKPQPAADLLMHVDELDGLPPIRWLIKDYLPEDSLVEVYGAPSAGKTQVVFDMAQTLAASGQTVIYVVGEGLRGYRSRKKAWQKFRNQNGGNLYIWREAVQLFEPPAVRRFIETIQPKKPALVVFDTLSRCSLGADENNQKDMGYILEALDTVRRDTGATVIAIHHTNATGGRERGSTVIRGGMSVMMEVSKDDDLIAVSCAKVKDTGEFNTLLLKPVLVDIGEETPVPVLIPAERRLQTQADKLSTLQLEILRAVGMEMFSMSGIKSNQLDEILPPITKRATKYHSLNILIRLGYVEPHTKGDPWKITEAGRLKLSNAETVITASMSNMSKASPNALLWTLPVSCPMSSPIPHLQGCGMNETLDISKTPETSDTNHQPEPLTPIHAADEASTLMSNVQRIDVETSPTDEASGQPPLTSSDVKVKTENTLSPDSAHLQDETDERRDSMSNVQSVAVETPQTSDNTHPFPSEKTTHHSPPLDTAAEPDAGTRDETSPKPTPTAIKAPYPEPHPPPMTELEIVRYSEQADVRYPTHDGADLYRIAQLIPLHLRSTFEAGLGEAHLAAYRAEVERRGVEPPEQPIPDILGIYLNLGFVSTIHLFEGYQRACQMGHDKEFLAALPNRNTKALDYLQAMISGKRFHLMMVIERLPLKEG